MTQFDIEANIRNLAGDLILALEDEANGFWVRGGGLLGQQRVPIVRESTSPWIDGSSLDGVTVGPNEGSLLIKAFGPSWPIVEARYQTVLNAAPLSNWLYEESVQGVAKLWRAGPVAVVEAPPTAADFANNRKFVVLTFRVQPSPTISGLGG